MKEIECLEIVKPLAEAAAMLELSKGYFRKPKKAAAIASEAVPKLKIAKEITLLSEEEYKEIMTSVAKGVFGIAEGRLEAWEEIEKAIEMIEDAIAENLKKCSLRI